MSNIAPIAERLGLAPHEWLPYGRDKAKIELAVGSGKRRREGPSRLVLVSAITPTPAGEGKTTISIGLAQGLNRIGKSVCLALRQPSQGPSFGAKGGATGGGRASITPAEEIDLHFTGDFHAITSANNLHAAMVDNAVHFGKTRIDPRRILWKRVLDVNDRSLREIVCGLGSKSDGVPRQSGFDITAASEVMAMFCLASDFDDLRRRIDRTIVAVDLDGKPVTAKDLKATGAMLALLKDAFLPNLVQTVDGVPAIVHGGPFANIAHGCNSVVATKTALNLADWVVTEAGFAFDLGGEKFYDIKCRSAGLDTAVVVLVATVRALKLHGGSKDWNGPPDAAVVEAGLPNLAKHIESVRMFGETPVVALNRFGADSEAEIEVVRRFCAAEDVPFAVCDAYSQGGDGAIELAQAVVANAEPQPSPFLPLYPLDLPTVEKIRTVARMMYGARDIVLSPEAEKDLARVKKWGLDGLPVCMAKTQNSLSDDPTRRGRPEGFDLRVRRIEVAAGAGFLVVLTGDIVRMPGLPEHPRAEGVDVVGGKIVGLV